MEKIKRYRVVIFGVLCLLVALAVTRQPKEPKGGRPPFSPPAEMSRAMPAALQQGVAEGQGAGSSGPERSNAAPGHSPVGSATKGGDGAEAEQEESSADSTVVEAVEFNPDDAKKEALAEVRRFDEELAATLWTFNPNARKARLKATQLKERAEDLEGWIETQDNRVDWSADEQKEWNAQRDVWLDHARELKEVSRKLVGTRGTRRKVRNIAREMTDKLDVDK